MNIALEERPKSEDLEVVRKGLASYNRSNAPDDNHQHLSLLLRDGDGLVVGGALGGTYWGYLYIDWLWVDEPIRRSGHGSALLAGAEQEAIKRGCRYAHLNTHSFQVVEFYERHGYRKVGELPNLPPGHSKFLLWKELDAVTTSTDRRKLLR